MPGVGEGAPKAGVCPTSLALHRWALASIFTDYTLSFRSGSRIRFEPAARRYCVRRSGEFTIWVVARQDSEATRAGFPFEP